MDPATKPQSEESGRQMLRHALATLAYRAGKALRDAPESFAGFSSGEKGRTPLQILAHMGDLFDWALSIAQGKQAWQDSAPLPWAQEVTRFSVRFRLLTITLPPARRSPPPRKNFFKARLPTP